MRNNVRWLAVPIAAYLVITLGLPAANGAAGNSHFLSHAMWVVLGCAIIVAVIAGFSLANNRSRSRVTSRGPT